MTKPLYLAVHAVCCLLAALACREPGSPPAPAAQEPAAAPADPHAHHAAPAHDPHEGHDEHTGHGGHREHVVSPEAPLPGASIYNTTAAFTDQRGEALELASLRGSVVLATMFYASCTSVCPMLVAQLARIDRALEPETRARTQLLLVSLDPERDSSEALQAVAKRHGIDDPRWHFVRTGEDSVREVAALLGIRYSKLPDGEISHSPLIALLDRDGALLTRMENAGGDPAELIAAASRAARGERTAEPAAP